MAGTTTKTRVTGHKDSDMQSVRMEHNKLVDDVDALVTKINAIITAAATNIAAVAAVPAATAATSAKVGDQFGNTTK